MGATYEHQMSDDIKIAVIGGSGLYGMDGLEIIEERWIDTPYGKPSDAIIIGRLNGVKIAFLPRHGRGHVHSPTSIPVRANVWALKSLGVFWVISVAACGSLKLEIPPRDFVIPDQIIDRTKSRVNSLFDGLTAHVNFANPFHPDLRRILLDAAQELPSVKTHDGGTYVCMEGPLFSTKAESNLYRSWGGSLIGMTAIPEAKLFREAEMCYASICLSTDYDCWHESDHVDIEEIMANVAFNMKNVQELIKLAVPRIPLGQEDQCDASRALVGAIMTAPDRISAESWERYGLFINHRIQRPS